MLIIAWNLLFWYWFCDDEWRLSVSDLRPELSSSLLFLWVYFKVCLSLWEQASLFLSVTHLFYLASTFRASPSSTSSTSSSSSLERSEAELIGQQGSYWALQELQTSEKPPHWSVRESNWLLAPPTGCRLHYRHSMKPLSVHIHVDDFNDWL